MQIRYIKFKKNMRHDGKKVEETHHLILMLWAEKYIFSMFLAVFLDGFFCTLDQKLFCALNQNGVP